MELYILTWSILFLCVNILHVTSEGHWAAHDKICHSCADGGDSITCYCDNMCTLYNDCCFDAAVMNRKRFQKYAPFSCFELFPSQGIYLINKCASRWISSTIRINCESPKDFGDLSMIVPVTDTNTNITYRNLHCAECNNVSPSNLLPFSLNVWCGNLLTEVNNTYGNITDDFIIQNLVHVGNSWGLHQWDPYLGEMSFIPCSLYGQVPGSLSSVVRSCHTGIIQTCADDWNSQLTRHRCMFSNMHIIYDTFGTLYRNEHCAVCNYIPMNNISCFPPRQPGYGFAGGGGYDPSLVPDFNALLKFWNTCGIHQIYDSESKRCRRLICPDPDQKAFFGSCVN